MPKKADLGLLKEGNERESAVQNPMVGASPPPRVSPLRLVATLVLALGLLTFFLWRAPLTEVGEALLRVRWGWVGAAVVFALSSYALRALRWGAILAPVGSAPAPALLGCTAAGFALNTILPGRLGEVARPLLLARKTGLPAAATLASILTERLIDLATLLVVFAAGVGLASDRLAPANAVALRHSAVLATLGLVAAMAVLFPLLHWRNKAVTLAAHLVPQRWRDRTARFLNHLLDGLGAVRSARRLVHLGGWSALVWGTAILQIAVLAQGFGLPLGFSASAVVIGVSVIGLAVPTPAGIGSFHAAVQFALATLLGADLANATAFAIVHHAVCFFPITLAGLGYMAVVGLRPSAAPALATLREE